MFDMLVFFTNFKFLVRFSDLFLHFTVIGCLLWFWIDSSQEIPINVEFPQVFILGPRLLLLYVDNLPGDVNVCNILPVMDVLFSTPTLSRFLICCNSMSWLLNLTLT